MLGERPSFTNDQEHQRLVTALRESEILRELAELLASSLDLKNILQALTKRTSEVCEVERCSVWLFDDSRHVFLPAAYYLSTQHVDREKVTAADHIWYHGSVFFDDPYLPHLLQEKGLLVVNDLLNNPKVRKVAETFLVRSILLIALKREDRILGMMSLDDPAQIRDFSQEQQQLARAIGQQAALAIDNARLYQQAQAERTRAERLIERARAIYQVALTVNSGEDLSVGLKIATQHLVRGLKADSGEIMLLNSETLYLANSTGPQQTHFNEPLITATTLQDLPDCQKAATTGSPLFLNTHQMTGSEQPFFQKLGFDNVLIVSLMAGGVRSITSTTGTQPAYSCSTCIMYNFVIYRDTIYTLYKCQLAYTV